MKPNQNSHSDDDTDLLAFIKPSEGFNDPNDTQTGRETSEYNSSCRRRYESRLGSYGDEVARTPNIDRLAQSVQIFTNVFTTSGSLCTQSSGSNYGQHQISMGAQHMRSSTSPHGKCFALPSEEVKAFLKY